MPRSVIIREGQELSLQKKDSEEYTKLGKITKIHDVETGFIFETDEGRMLKIKTKEPKPKDPDMPPKPEPVKQPEHPPK